MDKTGKYHKLLLITELAFSDNPIWENPAGISQYTHYKKLDYTTAIKYISG